MSSNAVNYFTNWKDTQRPWPTKKNLQIEKLLTQLATIPSFKSAILHNFRRKQTKQRSHIQKNNSPFPALGWMLKNWIHFLLGHHFSHSLTLDGNRKPARGSIHTTIPWASRTILRFCGREGSHNLHFGLRFQGSCVVKGRNCGGREWKFYEQVTIGTIACLHI